MLEWPRWIFDQPGPLAKRREPMQAEFFRNVDTIKDARQALLREAPRSVWMGGHELYRPAYFTDYPTLLRSQQRTPAAGEVEVVAAVE